MWHLLLEWFSAIFRGKALEHQRADFAAVSEQWEALANNLKKHLDDSLKRIEQLEQRLQFIQDEAEQCLRDRLKDSYELADLKVRVAQLEKKADHGS